MPSTDITYCTRDCENMECKRNKKILKVFGGRGGGKTLYISQCSFKDCKEWRDGKDKV